MHFLKGKSIHPSSPSLCTLTVWRWSAEANLEPVPRRTRTHTVNTTITLLGIILESNLPKHACFSTVGTEQTQNITCKPYIGRSDKHSSIAFSLGHIQKNISHLHGSVVVFHNIFILRKKVIFLKVLLLLAGFSIEGSLVLYYQTIL